MSHLHTDLMMSSCIQDDLNKDSFSCCGAFVFDFFLNTVIQAGFLCSGSLRSDHGGRICPVIFFEVIFQMPLLFLWQLCGYCQIFFCDSFRRDLSVQFGGSLWRFCKYQNALYRLIQSVNDGKVRLTGFTILPGVLSAR